MNNYSSEIIRIGSSIFNE